MTDPLLICAPMRIEARAVRQGLRGNPEVLHTGYGTTRAAQRAEELKAASFGQIAIMGVGAGLTTELRPGDLVVGTEAGLVTCPSAPLLAGELRRAGLSARTGRITTVDHLIRRSERASLAADGTLLADMESAPLATAAGQRPVAVVRAVSDTPDHPVASIVSPCGSVPSGSPASRPVSAMLGSRPMPTRLYPAAMSPRASMATEPIHRYPASGANVPC